MKSPGRLIFIMFLFICLCSNVFCQDLSIDRIINPFGWKLPDVAFLDKVSTETITYSGIPQKIIVETYRFTLNNWPSRKLPYYILEKQILPGGKVNPEAEVREWVERLKIFKKENNDEIVCYLFDCVVEPQPRDKNKEYVGGEIGGALDGISGDWMSNLILDLNCDGIMESLFSIYERGMTQEEVIIFVLKLKLGIATLETGIVPRG